MPASQPVQAAVVEPEPAPRLARVAAPDVLLAVRPEAALRRAASAAAVRPEARMLRRPLQQRRRVALKQPRRLPAGAAAARALRRNSWRRVSFRAVTSA